MVDVTVMACNVEHLRGNVDATVAAVRAAEPDVVIVHGGPRRLRWRTKSADLANRCGLIYAGGGLPSLGNLVLVSMRVSVQEAWYVQYPLIPGRVLRGAVLVRCSVAGTSFVAVGTQLTPDPAINTRLGPYTAHRAAQAAILAKVLSDVDSPVILAADVNDSPGSAAWRTLAGGRTDPAAALDGETGGAAIFADPAIEVADYQLLAAPAGRHRPVTAHLKLPA